MLVGEVEQSVGGYMVKEGHLTVVVLTQYGVEMMCCGIAYLNLYNFVTSINPIKGGKKRYAKRSLFCRFTIYLMFGCSGSSFLGFVRMKSAWTGLSTWLALSK